MTDIFIPASVNKIEKDAFSGCSDLEFISVSGDNKAYDSRDNCNAIIETASNKLIIGCKGTVIPNSVTSIGDHAFAHCYKLEKMLVPDSVKDMGEGAFRYCKKLKEIVLPNTLSIIRKEAFYSCET